MRGQDGICVVQSVPASSDRAQDYRASGAVHMPCALSQCTVYVRYMQGQQAYVTAQAACQSSQLVN